MQVLSERNQMRRMQVSSSVRSLGGRPLLRAVCARTMGDSAVSEVHKQASVHSIPRSNEVQVVRWQRLDCQPHQQTFRNRTLALRKAERLRRAGLQVAVYNATVSRWESIPVPILDG